MKYSFLFLFLLIAIPSTFSMGHDEAILRIKALCDREQQLRQENSSVLQKNNELRTRIAELECKLKESQDAINKVQTQNSILNFAYRAMPVMTFVVGAGAGYYYGIRSQDEDKHPKIAHT